MQPVTEALLRDVAAGQLALSAEQRSWCAGQLLGPLAAYNPLRSTIAAADDVLARCLLRAWDDETRCDCP